MLWSRFNDAGFKGLEAARGSNAAPTNVISQFDYTYDAAGRRTAIAKGYGGTDPCDTVGVIRLVQIMV